MNEIHDPQPHVGNPRPEGRNPKEVRSPKSKVRRARPGRRLRIAASRWPLVLAATVAIGAMAPLGRAAEMELFVTDYNQNPGPVQRALADEPLVFPSPQSATINTAEGKRVTIESPLSVTVRKGPTGDTREANIFASPGEFEPFSFLFRPSETLSTVFIRGGELKGPGGAVVPTENVVVRSVEGFLGAGRDILMPLGRPWSMSAHSTESFWCTVKVPDKAPAGTYKGEVTVTEAGRTIGAIQVCLEVLPIKLTDPPFSLGLNYSKPDADPDGWILAAHFKDMRDHGMTCVAPLYDWHLPIDDSDTSELAALLEVYKRAGFPGTFYWAAPMSLHVSELAGYGDETSRRWQQKYLKVMRRMHEEVAKHGVPTIFSIGDELTNKGLEGIKSAGRLAKFVWEELPEIACTSDMNGYLEVMTMAPFLNVATFNNGWDGADHHNHGRRLLNKAFLAEVQTTGAIPWFVNAGSGRFPFGFFFWKMSHYGVKGKVEWYYNLRNEGGSLVRTQKDQIYPTLDYERCREGIDDLKYLCKLESVLAKADASTAQARAARELLESIDAGIADDWALYEGKGGLRFPDDGFARLDPTKVASFGRLNSIRWEVAKAIVALESTTGKVK